MSNFLIACGGTGGHLAPGIAIAEILQDRGHSCTLLISQKEVDSALIKKYPHLTFYKTPGRAFAGGITTLLSSTWSLFNGLFFARRLVREERPDAVLLFGGFLSVGLGLAARMAKIPVALHEANCQPGKASRLMKHLADRIYLPDGVRMRGTSLVKVRYFGYPVRRDIKHILKVDAWQRLGIEVPNKLLVIIGGSQGASVFNEWVRKNFESLADAGISVYCVTGLGKASKGTIQALSKEGETITASFVPFTDAMGEVLSAADLVISRAGAGAIAEITHCRAPAILVPYPFAADDHQQANALMHERHGAGLIVLQKDMGKLEAEVYALIFNDWLLSKFKSNLKHIDRVDSGQRIAKDLEDICTARALSKAEKLEPAV